MENPTAWKLSKPFSLFLGINIKDDRGKCDQWSYLTEQPCPGFLWIYWLSDYCLIGFMCFIQKFRVRKARSISMSCLYPRGKFSADRLLSGICPGSGSGGWGVVADILQRSTVGVLPRLQGTIIEYTVFPLWISRYHMNYTNNDR